MQQRITRYTAVALSLLLLLAAVLSMASCASAEEIWNRLWLGPPDESVDINDLVLGDGSKEYEINTEGAVPYTGDPHEGTDIFYVAPPDSPNRNRIIAIDAGHQLKGSSETEPNGPDSDVMKPEVSWGATGIYTGQNEYELNLAVALLLRDELIQRGYSVVMIRETNNVRVSNMERAEIANRHNAAAYIRIHANSWTDDTMRGALTVCQSRANPYPTCAAHYESSRLLSELVLERFCVATAMDQLPVREMDDMTGTNWSRVPTTIVEMGFLSNKTDDSMMSGEDFRKKAARGIADGLDAYFAAPAK